MVRRMRPLANDINSHNLRPHAADRCSLHQHQHQDRARAWQTTTMMTTLGFPSTHLRRHSDEMSEKQGR